jgi:hypothetical protein
MTRFILVPLTVVLAWSALAVAPASAQFTYPFRPPQYGPYYQTQLSPYLNMLRPGDPAVNFYTGVVPEVQRRQDRNAIYSSLQGLGSQIPLPPGITNRDIDLPLASTGHPTAFGYTGTYFAGNMAGRYFGNPFGQRRGMGGMGMGGMGMGGMGMGGMGMGGGGFPGMGMGQGSSGVWPQMNMSSGGMQAPR